MEQKFIPLSVPCLKGRELEYVTEAIQSEWVSTSGPYVDEFERKVANYVKAKGAVSCQNGTSGLHIALKICGVTSKDEVIVPTLTFIATVNPVRYVGANPIFMDCDDSLCIDPEKLYDFCQKECTFVDGKLINNRTKKHIKAIIVVHVFGKMADMVRINQIAEQFNLTVIEDATEALGTYYTTGMYAGKFAGTLGTVGVYSFNGNKIITTGGGGMIVSDDEVLLKRAKHLTTQAKVDDLYYVHDEVGYNYRLTNLQAALGLAQMEQLESFIAVKKRNFQLYEEGVKNIPGLSMLGFNEDIRSNYWFYALYFNEEYPLNKKQFIEYMMSKKIQVRPIWGLIHEQKPYRNCQTYKIEKAKHYFEHIINVPCSSNLSEDDVHYVLECLKNPQTFLVGEWGELGS